jgi:AraC family transcriptional regulator, regulatory protein of adaptative response / methylated-DNA-[protein]-cysteine methyltransferase
MITASLPPADEMYAALANRDASYDGIFFTAVRTTGIFCRPICPARTPARPNVEFFASTREALFAGYRPCLRCRPMEQPEATPDWVKPLIADLESSNGKRWTDDDLRARGLDPARVRRWFKQAHGMTFHAYHRAQRVGRAAATIRQGERVTTAAFEQGYESLSAFYEAFRALLDTTPARGRDAQPLYFTRIDTPLGPMLAAASDEGLALLEFVDRRMLETQLRRMSTALGNAIVPGTNAVLDQTIAELKEYFEGRRTEFTVPLVLAGSPFQQSVWRELQTVPFAATRSYGEQARRLGKPEAVRAVARANGDNRIAIIIPCHRIIGSDGKLTGYGGGLWRKKWLLDHEVRLTGGLVPV